MKDIGKSILKCPVCDQRLNDMGASYECNHHHHYDKNKFSAVNLLMSQKMKQKHHGDDRKMVLARRRFLSQGVYQNIAYALIDELQGGSIYLDIGCGEGWYTNTVHQHVKNVHITGVDISKEAINLAAKHNKEICWVVGSSFNLPILDKSVDISWSIFAPFSISEVIRTTKNLFIHVFPLEQHLIELKEQLYEKTYLNKVPALIDELEYLSEKKVQEVVRVNQLDDLVMMTPYGYRTARLALHQLQELKYLDVTLAVGVRLYKIKEPPYENK